MNFPIKIEIVDGSLMHINWSDGVTTKIGLQKLRKLCPCAECIAERETQTKTYIPLYTPDQLTLEEINLVGSYAISLKWRDGHSTGIYEFPFLHRITLNSMQ